MYIFLSYVTENWIETLNLFRQDFENDQYLALINNGDARHTFHQISFAYLKRFKEKLTTFS